MPKFPGFRRYVRLPRSTPGRIDREIDEELQFHLDMRADELRDVGLTSDKAKVEALRRFGDLPDARAYCRTQDRRRDGIRRWTDILDEAWQDAVIAVRQLRQRPMFAAAALLTLALGIGANTAIYALVNAYLVRPFPFPNDDRIAAVIPGPSRQPFPNAPPLGAVDWRRVDSTFDGTVAWDLDGFTVVGAGDPEYVDGAWVSPGYFDVLGVRAVVGRGFRPDDFNADAHVALISHALWTRRFARDRTTVGRTVRMYSTDRPTDPQLVTIVGVLPENAWHLNRFTDVLRPLATPRTPSLVRLRAGMPFGEAGRRLTTAVRAQLPSTTDAAWHMALVSVRDEHTHEVRPMLLALGAAGTLLLLMTCANVGGLVATRGSARRREMSVRSALGAGRGRLIRQLLVEAVVLCMIAGAAGIGLAQVSIRAIARTVERQLGATIPGGEANLRVDSRVFLAAIITSALVVLLIGVRNALVGSRADLAAALRMAGGGAGAIDRRSRTRLLTIQVALAFALLVGAGLTLRSAAQMSNVALGFDPTGVMKAHVLFPVPRYPSPADRQQVMSRVLRQIGGDRGIVAVASVFPHPFRGSPPASVTTDATAASGPSQLPEAVPHTISAGYFDVMRIPRVAGRAFVEADVDGPAVAIVSAVLAERLWPGESALGRRLRIGDDSEWRTVVGIVRDVRKAITGELLPDVYVPFDQAPRAYTAIVARGRGGATSVGVAIRRGLASVDPALAPSDEEALADVIARETARPRALAAVISGFATFALLLAALGLGGATANIIVQRKRELAVRMAVGATGADVLRLLLRDAARVIALGLGLGMVAAIGLGRLLSSQLFGVGTGDPWTYASVAVVLGAVGLTATALPGYRATRIDPAAALRDT